MTAVLRPERSGVEVEDAEAGIMQLRARVHLKRRCEQLGSASGLRAEILRTPKRLKIEGVSMS